MEIVNKVAESGIVTLDLAGYVPNADDLMLLDLKPFLFREMIVKEKEYRASVKDFDWQIFAGKQVAVSCSTDAIIPVWAFMLVTTALKDIARSVHFGTIESVTNHIIAANMQSLNVEEYTDKRVVLKGCGDKEIPVAAYVAASDKLLPVVKSLMYGEPCSTVPVYKKKA